jgi:hypothetical protein
MDKSSLGTVDPAWKSLYRIGGTAPLIALVFYLTQIFILIFGEPYPTNTEGWFSLFQHSKLLGLFYLNVLDIFSIALLGTMFLALYIALRRDNESYMAIAAFFAFIGIAVFVSLRVATLSMLPLSDQYAAAATDAQRSQFLAAGETLGSLGMPTPQTMGFLFMAVAVLIISIVMLRSETFSKVTAYVGILVSVTTFADDISVVIAPSIADILMPISGVLWVIWWILISRRLLQLGYLSQEQK